MNDELIAAHLVDAVGGVGNIETMAHCATRLRFVLKDESLANKAKVEELDAVDGCFSHQGQFQIILGTGVVNRIHGAIASKYGSQLTESSNEELKKAAMANMNPIQRLARLLSNIFVPIIPAIVASGLLMGLLGMVKTYNWLAADSAAITLLDMFSNTAFVFLPILIAYSAAREFKTSPVLAIVVAGIMIHPALQNAWTMGGGVQNTIDLFGFNIAMIGYQGTVLPVLLVIWAMSYVERGIRKVTPDWADLLVTPLLTVLITGLIALLLLGPAGRILGDGLSFGLQALYDKAGPLAGLVFGGLYSTIVISGVHHSFHAIEAGLLANADIAINFLLPIWAVANVSQGGAAMGVFLRTRDEKLKALALPASLTCMLGITEPAIFGVNLRLVRPFIGAAIGGAVSGCFIVLMKVGFTGIGLTGIPALAIAGSSLLPYIIGMILAFVASCLVTILITPVAAMRIGGADD
ncbi:sucrose-specific PTS transporter subunit IIBC [Reinekea marinisedimentorum]|uniref:PTS system sucrose-specific IIC component n=1 Tax=Reinekea marinisedimentorum TaxID=230495 RepID=A0A4R3I7Y4_9GAMM|nr:sucrose-specific PTS transporter subunit IIBC [Reinekea marinisedimentorum]TCS42353.1 PTS system sucrose-specific IIC component [Reinekea marinisedimentorum]